MKDLVEKYLGEAITFKKVDVPRKDITVMKEKIGKVDIRFSEDKSGAVVNLSVGSGQSTKMLVKNINDAKKKLEKMESDLKTVKNNKELRKVLNTIKTQHGMSY